MGDRLWSTQTGEIAPLWCTALIFDRTGGNYFIPPVLLHQSNHYTQDLHYNIPSDWVVHNSPSGYMDCGGWHKSMADFSSMCSSSPLNPQVLFYDGYDNHFYYRGFDIVLRHNIQSFILKTGYYVHDQPNDNGPNTKIIIVLVIQE